MVDIVPEDEHSFSLVRVAVSPHGKQWITFVVGDTRAGQTSGRTRNERLKDLLEKTPALMKKAYEDALATYEILMKKWDGKEGTRPRKPIPAVPDFNEHVPLRRRVEWLQYGDFDDAGLDLVQVVEGPMAFVDALQVE